MTWEDVSSTHKVIFDGSNKLIRAKNGVTLLNWSDDVYAAWKEWVAFDAENNSAAFDPAMNVTGGDNLTVDGSRKLGLTYFLLNGWKFKPWSGNHTIKIVGNVFTDDDSSIFVPADGAYTVAIELVVSSNTEIITTSTSTPTAPTATEIASAVWNSIGVDFLAGGSFGEHLNLLKASSALQTTEILGIRNKLNEATAIIETILKYHTNRTRVDSTEKKLYVYDDDGVSVLSVFDLKNFSGGPTITEVAERIPV